LALVKFDIVIVSAAAPKPTSPMELSPIFGDGRAGQAAAVLG
jgi:hypothetical protein